MSAKRLRRWGSLVVLAAAGVLVATRFTSEDDRPPTPVVISNNGLPRGTIAFLPATYAVVSAITDGDTLRLDNGDRVRLLQIDAPEPGECFAQASKAELERGAPRGARPDLYSERRFGLKDDYGRLLLYVVIDDRVINLQLVRRGAAVPYFFRGKRGVHANELLEAAQEARRQRRGLWGACPGAKLDPNRGSLTGPA